MSWYWGVRGGDAGQGPAFAGASSGKLSRDDALPRLGKLSRDWTRHPGSESKVDIVKLARFGSAKPVKHFVGKTSSPIDLLTSATSLP